MTEEEFQLVRDVALTDRIRLLALRDVIGRLLAYVARNEPNPEVVLRNFFEAGDARIAGFEANSSFELQTSDLVQQDKDWIVGLARRLMGA
jgi:hypothetical protein